MLIQPPNPFGGFVIQKDFESRIPVSQVAQDHATQRLSAVLQAWQEILQCRLFALCPLQRAGWPGISTGNGGEQKNREGSEKESGQETAQGVLSPASTRACRGCRLCGGSETSHQARPVDLFTGPGPTFQGHGQSFSRARLWERSKMRLIVLSLIRAYQALISPLYPSCCRFVPTCSEYALEAVRVHGALKGGWLALRRLLRCHPLARGGYDPLPGSDALKTGSSSRTEHLPSHLL